jgi:heme/copper-type cytochrome/quinol oxidase subunit 3
LTLKTGAYGALFYSLISCHALHVIGGLILLGITLKKLQTHQSLGSGLALMRDASERDLTPEVDAREWVGHSEVYWHFVTGVWLVLFGIIYLL